MNNEEQIMSMLEALTTTVGALAQGQAEMRADIAGLKVGQAKLEAGQAETNSRLEKLEARVEDLTVKVDGLSDKSDRLEAHALRIDSTQSDILGKLDFLASEDKKIVESMYKFDDAGRERHIQMMKKIETIQRVTELNTCDIAELRATQRFAIHN